MSADLPPFSETPLCPKCKGVPKCKWRSKAPERLEWNCGCGYMWATQAADAKAEKHHKSCLR